MDPGRVPPRAEARREVNLRCPKPATPEPDRFSAFLLALRHRLLSGGAAEPMLPLEMARTSRTAGSSNPPSSAAIATRLAASGQRPWSLAIAPLVFLLPGAPGEISVSIFARWRTELRQSIRVTRDVIDGTYFSLARPSLSRK